MTLRVFAIAVLGTLFVAAPAGAKDRVAFMSGSDIWVVGADGSGMTNLTQTPAAPETKPMWSPDARRIAYQRFVDGFYQIWAMSPDGTDQALLIARADRHLLGPSWSPDGKRIAYMVYDPMAGTGQLVASNLDGTNVTPLASEIVHDFTVAWSPDGTKVLYSNQQLALKIARTDGSGQATLINPSTQSATQAKWSPDGTRIVYMGCPEFSLCGNNDVWVMDSDGTGNTRLTTNEGHDSMPAFSADGKRIVYARTSGGLGYEMRVMDATGANDAALPGPAPGSGFPDWEPLGDEDGDGLRDVWETDGIDTDGDGTIDLDLPAMGADPRAKDIFLEIDYAAPHQLEQAAVNKVVAAFAAAPVANPDGTTGIALHADNGPSSIMDPREATSWGSLSRHDDIPHAAVTGSVAANHYDWSTFDVHKGLHFDPERAQAFHYAISAHGHAGTSTGIARGIPSSDLLVTLGAGCEANTGSDCTLDADAQAGTLMHELGHNLGLRHGGEDDVKYKPTYLSVMNYAFQLEGLYRANLTTELDYARFGLSLDESALDEAAGLGAADGSAAAGFNTLARCPSGAQVMWPVLAGPLDFNCDSTTGGVVASDTNADGVTGTLAATADWPRIVFKGGAVGALGVPVPVAETELTEPPLAELQEVARIAAAYVPVPRVLTPSPPGAPGLPVPAAPVPPAARAGAPALSALRVRPASFAVVRRGGGDRRRLGSTIHYTLGAAGRVRLSVERWLPGRRAGNRCVTPRRALRGRACRRVIRVAGRLSHVGRGGANRFAFSGRVGGRALAPGSYALVATALGDDGRPGAARRASFRVLR